MLIIRAWVGPSKIQGLGLIAHEFIPKGTVIWKLVPGFDLLLSDEEVKNLPPSAQEQVYHYAFFHPKLKKHVLCADDDKFTNHSDNANSRFCDDHAITIRDIQEGEEITDNYSEYGYRMHRVTRPPMKTL